MATSWPIKFHTAAKPGVKRKSNKNAQNKNNEKYEAYRKQLFLSSWATDGYKYKMTTKKEWLATFVLNITAQYRDKF